MTYNARCLYCAGTKLLVTDITLIKSITVQCTECCMWFDLSKLDPENYPAFRPPNEISILDRHGGFTYVELRGDNFGGTRWAPGRVLHDNTIGHLIAYWENFYQNNNNVVQAITSGSDEDFRSQSGST